MKTLIIITAVLLLLAGAGTDSTSGSDYKSDYEKEISAKADYWRAKAYANLRYMQYKVEKIKSNQKTEDNEQQRFDYQHP